ncbi:MAG TPA: hypothetical protein VIJ64_11190 [Candidatus Lustribacter sp.]
MLRSLSANGCDLGMGSSFGNSAIWVNTQSTGAVERVYSNALAQRLIGTISLRYGGYGSLPNVQNADPSAHKYVALRPEPDSRRFNIHLFTS